MSNMTPFISLQYASLLEVVIDHAYYDQGFCPHVTLAPSPACQQLLRQHRLRFMPSPMGGKLVGETPSVVTLPPASAPVTWEFFLQMRDTEFLAVTAICNAGQRFGNAAYLFDYQDGAWTSTSGQASPLPLPASVICCLRIAVPLTSGTTAKVRLALPTPEVTWDYYVVTGDQYAPELKIAANGSILSRLGTVATPEAQMVSQRYPGKKITHLQVQLHLKRDFPAWYLVTNALSGGSGTVHVPDVPPLPKPRLGAPPHLILDYSAILK